MNKIVMFVVGVLMTVSCSTVKYVPISDSENIHKVDSTIIQYRDTTIFVEVPVEVVKEVVPQLDTLYMETSLSHSTSYLDTTTRTLKGELKNKLEPIEKIVYLPSKEHIVYRDSIITKEVPVEVILEKPYTPKWCWYSVIFNVIVLCYIGFKIYLKFRL
jgi:hypothetical protein